MPVSAGRIPAGTHNGKSVVAAVEDKGSVWPDIVKHVSANGPFNSPDHLRQVFPNARFTVEDAPIRV
jgi:hypothetical protein